MGGFVEAWHELFLGDLVLGEVSVFAGQPATDGVVSAYDASANGAEFFVDALLVVVAGARWCVLEVGVVLALGWVVGVDWRWGVWQGWGWQ